MADSFSPARPSIAQGLARCIARRRQSRRRLALAALVGAATVPLAASILWRPPPLILWNVSPSAPIGLYRLHPEDELRRGDMAAAWTPEPVRELAARRHYLPANVPLVKRVAAVSGDRVCAAGTRISINRAPVAARQRSDAEGRPMPWWSGCRTLNRDEYFLLMEGGQSFDGRYFGPSRRGDIMGRAELVWAMPAKHGNDG